MAELQTRRHRVYLPKRLMYYSNMKMCNYLLSLYPIDITDAIDTFYNLIGTLPAFYINSGIFYWLYSAIYSSEYNYQYSNQFPTHRHNTLIKHCIHKTANETIYVLNITHITASYLLLEVATTNNPDTTKIFVNYDCSLLNDSLGCYARYITQMAYDTIASLDVPKNQLSPKLKVALYNDIYRGLLTPVLDRIDPDTLLIKE